MQTPQECRTALEKGERITSLAALIEVALDDAQRLDRKRYVPHNGHWLRLFVSPKAPDKRCHLCLAGMTLKRTIGAEPYTEGATLGELDMRTEQRAALYALDEVRRGMWADAMHRLGILKHPDRVWSHVPLSIRKRLPWFSDPRQPANLQNLRWFVGWEPFDRLAEVLREAVPVLREIEAGFLATEHASC